MFKKLICFFFGHKTIVKAYTGRQIQTKSLIGETHIIQLYVYKRMDYCVRCGKIIEA
jgi:hypothetical protein